MKKLNVLQVFMLVFCVAVFSVSCSKDDEGIEIYDETSTELYNRNLKYIILLVNVLCARRVHVCDRK